MWCVFHFRGTFVAKFNTKKEAQDFKDAQNIPSELYVEFIANTSIIDGFKQFNEQPNRYNHVLRTSKN